MGHLLSTSSRIEAEEAAARATPADNWEPAGPPLTEDHNLAKDRELVESVGDVSRETSPVPGIGHIVVYHLRTGDSRNRRSQFPAIVMDVDAETQLLKLWVIVDDGDTWMQDSVAARVAPEPGWERVDPVGIFVEIPDAVIATIDALRARIDRLEGTAEVLGKGAGVPHKLTTAVKRAEARITAIETHPALSVPPMTSPEAYGVPDKRQTATSSRQKRRG